MNILVGIDIGTSSAKVTLFNLDGHPLKSESSSYPTEYPKKAWVQQDAERWYYAVCEACKKLLMSLPYEYDILGIGIAGQGWATVPIDKDGNVLSKVPIWLDGRAHEETKDLLSRFGEEYLFGFSGNPLSANYCLPKILWFQNCQSDIYRKTQFFLQSNGYIGYRLTGIVSQDISQAYGFTFFDMKNGRFDNDFARQLGFDLDKIPPLCKCHDLIGRITKRAHEDTSLPIGTPVFAGGLDAACATLGVGAIHHGQTQEQGGQAGGISICLDSMLSHPRLILGFHVVPNQWLLQGGTIAGGNALRWFGDQFGLGNDYSSMTDGCANLAAGNDGVIFLPYLQGERSPLWDPNAKGVFYGIRFSTTRDHFIRAILEGVAYSLRQNLETASEAFADVSNLLSTGGASKNHLWMQIKADVTGIPITAPSIDDTTALGAALIAGVGLGVYDNYDQAVARAVHPGRLFTPNQTLRPLYDQSYALYQQIYQDLRETMKIK
jgi:xylulokinase